MLMLRAYKYRAYPNVSQRILLGQAFGCVRKYWNECVSSFNSYDKDTNPRPVVPTPRVFRQTYDWALLTSAGALAQKRMDFEAYRKHFFDKQQGLGRPRFHKKGGRDSFRLPNQKFTLRGDRIRLEKIGWVRIVVDRSVPDGCKFMSCTVSRDADGRYYVSVLVETVPVRRFARTGRSVGLDVGLKSFVTTSDGVVVENPRLFRDSQLKLSRLQRLLSHKVKGSRRYRRLRRRVASVHGKIKRQRNHFLHVLTTGLVRDYDVLCVEDLNIKGMLANHRLALSISDASWGDFYRMLKYKCDWYGRDLRVVGRFAPTSKTCSVCGWRYDALTLDVRSWTCPACGSVHDRDVNAAVNILALGVGNALRSVSVGSGGRVPRRRHCDPNNSSMDKTS